MTVNTINSNYIRNLNLIKSKPKSSFATDYTDFFAGAEKGIGTLLGQCAVEDSEADHLENSFSEWQTAEPSAL